MKTKWIVLLLVAMLAAVSCAKEEIVEYEPTVNGTVDCDHSVIPGVALVEFSDEMSP